MVQTRRRKLRKPISIVYKKKKKHIGSLFAPENVHMQIIYERLGNHVLYTISFKSLMK
jgi:sensor histidine kinase YesM